MTSITPVIMVGGSGTRLWPMSRQAKPKQFQALVSEKSMFQETVLRAVGADGDTVFNPPIIIGGDAYLEVIEQQLAGIDVIPARIILEPSAQNTAAVAAIAAQAVAELGSDLVLLLASDAYIARPNAFRTAIASAADTAMQGWITTFGITPTRPETAYGYVKLGRPLGPSCYTVDVFTEKPDAAGAARFLSDGNYAWNAGLFIFAPGAMLDEMATHAPDIMRSALSAAAAADIDGAVRRLDAEIFAQCEKLSVDYAVMEKTDKAAVFGPVDIGWSDVGSWDALGGITDRAPVGDVVQIDTEGCYFRAENGSVIAALGVKDLIVVSHDGVTLVLPSERAQDIKMIIEELKVRQLSSRL